MIISLIAAMGRNRVIGNSGDIPWMGNVPADLKYFRDVTRGKPVIMGRKTFISIGHALPDRINIVMTRDAALEAPGCMIALSREEAMRMAGDADEVMVIGGEGVFKEFLPVANRIYLTLIDVALQGDTFFPELDPAVWQEVSREEHQSDEKNLYAYTFLTLEKK
ncbi:MAG: dihydrofolate reductase [Candidatus Sungbacteria bacterium]|nr:dihydrofolate reductase [Candidatus Sungbacteria bacterium]